MDFNEAMKKAKKMAAELIDLMPENRLAMQAWEEVLLAFVAKNSPMLMVFAEQYAKTKGMQWSAHHEALLQVALVRWCKRMRDKVESYAQQKEEIIGFDK